MTADTPGRRLATRLAFLAAGFGMACWAPLVPYAKARLGADDALVGLLLLCFGLGSVVSMPVTGGLTGRIGSRPMILLGGAGLCLVLPLLAAVGHPAGLAVALLLFGAALGSIDVAMNVHAVEVERAAPVPLMSGFHALFSLGGILGAGGMSGLLALGVAPVAAAGAGAAAIAVALLVAAPLLSRSRAAAGIAFLARPRGFVLLLGGLAFAAFLMEGAMLDWGALLLTQSHGLPAAQGGLGYAVFSAAMTLGRLTGDRITARAGPRRVLFWGGLLAIFGIAVLLLAPVPLVALSGFLLIGLGGANLVPVLFSAAGRQRAMPPGLAIAAMTTIGYAGVLAGPGLLGFVAQWAGLPAAFALLAVLMLAVPAAARIAAR